MDTIFERKSNGLCATFPFVFSLSKLESVTSSTIIKSLRYALHALLFSKVIGGYNAVAAIESPPHNCNDMQK